MGKELQLLGPSCEGEQDTDKIIWGKCQKTKYIPCFTYIFLRIMQIDFSVHMKGLPASVQTVILLETYIT